MVNTYGYCVFACDKFEIYEELKGPNLTQNRYFWKAFDMGKLHGPFSSIADAHLHHDIFVKAVEAPDFQNVIFVNFQERKRVC